jgi:hypothetical protein
MLSRFLSFASPLSCPPSLTRLSYSALLRLLGQRLGTWVSSPSVTPVSQPFGPTPLLQPLGTTKALTPAPRHPGAQVSPLISPHLPDVPPPTTRCIPASLYTPFPAYRTLFGLRPAIASSSSHPAESSSFSCGPPVRFRLLPTPPRDDAVTFSYRALAYPGTDFHRADAAPSRAHDCHGPSGLAMTRMCSGLAMTKVDRHCEEHRDVATSIATALRASQ